MEAEDELAVVAERIYNLHALLMAGRVVTIVESLKNDPVKDTGDGAYPVAMGFLGRAHKTLGNYAEARIAFREEAEGHRKLDSLRGVASGLRGLGQTYARERDFERASQCFEEAISCLQMDLERIGTDLSDQPTFSKFYESKTDLLATFASLAQVLCEDGEPHQAIDLLNVVIEQLNVMEQIDPTDCEPRRALCYSLMGSCLLLENQFGAAETYFRDAIGIFERTRPTSIDFLVSQVGLASTLNATDRFEAAASVAERAAVSLDSLYRDHPALVSKELGDAYFELGVASAMAFGPGSACHPLLKATLLYSNNPAVAKSKRNRTLVLWRDALKGAGRLEEAGVADAELKRIEHASETPDSESESESVARRTTEAKILIETGQFESAEKVLRDLVGTLTNLATKDPETYRFELPTRMQMLSYVLLELARFEEALAVASDVLQRRLDIVKGNPVYLESEYANAYSDYAFTLSQSSKFEQASTAFEKAIELFTRLSKENPNSFDKDLACVHLLYGKEFAYSDYSDGPRRNIERALEIFADLEPGDRAFVETEIEIAESLLVKLDGRES